MKISIITVCFNSEKYIRETIESVITQDYPDIEYIVIDGASKDRTVSIINEYKSKIAYFVSEKDKNMYDAINKGMRVATGEYIAILNSDDFYVSPTVVSRVAGKLKSLDKSKYLGVYGDLVKIDEQGRSRGIRRGIQVSFKGLLASEQLTFVGHGTVFLHRSVLGKVGFYADELFSAACDYDYLLRCFKLKPLKHIAVPVMGFRDHPESITSSGKIGQEVRAVLLKNGWNKRSRLLYLTLWGIWCIKNFRAVLRSGGKRLLRAVGEDSK